MEPESVGDRHRCDERSQKSPRINRHRDARNNIPHTATIYVADFKAHVGVDSAAEHDLPTIVMRVERDTGDVCVKSYPACTRTDVRIRLERAFGGLLGYRNCAYAKEKD